MDLSDDIAYSVHDFEDAIVNGYIDVAALGARVDHDALVDVDVRRGSAARSTTTSSSPRSTGSTRSTSGSTTWDGSRRDQGRLKNLTSQLIGRFAHARRPTRRGRRSRGASLIRFGADVVVPREIQAEIAVLKGIVAAFVMSTEHAPADLRAAARRCSPSSPTCCSQTGDEHLDPGFADDWRRRRRRRRPQARRRRPGREPHRPVGARLARAARAAVTARAAAATLGPDVRPPTRLG